MPRKRKFVQCRSEVNREAVQRKSIDGVEHIIVKSVTLPDDIVMNGGLYPSEEIDKSYDSLERTLAPVEHPTNSDGMFISANDPEAIHNFHAGAFNVNVERKNGRVYIEKHINVQEASRTDRGKRLLDRINELETSDTPRAVHTSVGVFLEIEELDQPKTNAAGEKYTWIARDMVFDHDAILLDSIGAATPEKGVGMGVNSEGKKVDIEQFDLKPNHLNIETIKAATNLPLADSAYSWDSEAAARRVRQAVGASAQPNEQLASFHLWHDADNADDFDAYKLPFVDIVNGEAMAIPAALRRAAVRINQDEEMAEADREALTEIIDVYLEDLQSNSDGISFNQITSQLQKEIQGTVGAEWMYVEDVYDDKVIFETNTGIFEVPWVLDNGVARIVGIPMRVDRIVTYQPKTNAEGDAMKELILNALKEAKIETEGLSDDALMAAYDELVANQSGNNDDNAGGEDNEIASIVANAIKPLTDEIGELKSQMNSQAETEKDELATLVANSGKYPGLDVDSAKMLPADKLKEMASHCGASHGLPLATNFQQNSDSTFDAPAEMPE